MGRFTLYCFSCSWEGSARGTGRTHRAAKPRHVASPHPLPQDHAARLFDGARQRVSSLFTVHRHPSCPHHIISYGNSQPDIEEDEAAPLPPPTSGSADAGVQMTQRSPGSARGRRASSVHTVAASLKVAGALKSSSRSSSRPEPELSSFGGTARMWKGSLGATLTPPNSPDCREQREPASFGAVVSREPRQRDGGQQAPKGANGRRGRGRRGPVPQGNRRRRIR